MPCRPSEIDPAPIYSSLAHCFATAFLTRDPYAMRAASSILGDTTIVFKDAAKFVSFAYHVSETFGKLALKKVKISLPLYD